MSDLLIVGEGGLDYNLEGLLHDSRTNGDAVASNAFNTTIPQGEYLLLDALARLNDIGAGINTLTGGDASRVEATLRLIVERRSRSCQAHRPCSTRSTHAAARSTPSRASRPASGWAPPPRSAHASRTMSHAVNGLGIRAVNRRGPVLSYEEPSLDIHPAKVAAGAKVLACLPLVVAANPVGVLYVYLREARRFTQLELLLLSVFVNQAAIAMYHAEQLSDVQRAGPPRG